MKIWITRENVDSMKSGGIDRLHVWFHKPKYIHTNFPPDHFDPEEYRYGRWQVEGSGKIERGSISFGYVFGRNNSKEDPELHEMSVFVWEKLWEHFYNTEMDKWSDLEDSGKSLPENFLLEIEIRIDFSSLAK